MRNSLKWFITITFTVLCLYLITSCDMDVTYGNHGDSKETAISLSKENTWWKGELTSSRTEQWFKFTATAYTQYLHVFFGTLTELTIQLYDNNDNPVDNSVELYNSGGNNKATYMVYSVTRSKTYYIKVTGASNSIYYITFNNNILPPAVPQY